MKAPSDIKFQMAIFGVGAAGFDPPEELTGIEWLICRKIDSDRLEFHSNGATLSYIDFQKPRFDLPGLIALFVVGDPAEHRWLTARWAECFAAVDLDIVEMSALDGKSLARCSVAALTAKLAQQRSFGGQAALDLAVYRREFERLQHSFSRLEEFVSEYSLHKPIKLFAYPPVPLKIPNDATQTSAGVLSASRVLQILPVDSLGVSGFALHLRTKLRVGDTLLIALTAIENDRCFGTWSIDAASASVGWLHFALSHAIDQPALGLVVTIDLPVGLAPSVLDSGQPHPYAEFCARIAGGESYGAPLALQVFGGLPGVRVAGVTGAIPQTNAPRPPVTIVPGELCAGVIQVFPATERDRSNFVIYDAALKVITVHPHEKGTMTIARIDLVPPPNAWRCSAQISLAHELANPVRFALMAAPFVKKGGDSAIVENLDEDSIWFSGWVALSALDRERISVFIPKTGEQILSIYLLTRQAPDASPDFAWARFENFQFNGDPKVPAHAGRDDNPARNDHSESMVDVRPL